MAFITWSDNYSVLVKAMDDQHKTLVNLINQLHDAMREGKANEAMGQILGGLINYVRNHFATEERLMQSCGFPGLAQHKTEHEKLTQQVMDLLKQVQSGRSSVSITVMQFLKDWLVNHMCGSDRQYGLFIKTKAAA